jgi:hypothetical protein
LRYDMGRRPSDPPADGPDVTSTGMSTFGGTAWDVGADPLEMPVAGRMPEPRRSPRRAVAVSALGLLTVLGAAAAYLVVVNGLVPMRDEKPAAAGTLPAATADSGIGSSGRSPRVTRDTTTTTPTDPLPPAVGTLGPRPAGNVVAPMPPRQPGPDRTVKPTSPVCRCGKSANPPVPTPTAPTSSPSPTSSSPASSPSASPSDDPSDDPGESPEPRKSWKPGHHRRHH